MMFPVRKMGSTRLLAYWLRLVLPHSDRQFLARFLNDVRGDLSKRSQRQIDVVLEIVQNPNAEPEPFMVTLLALARADLARTEEVRKLEN